LLKELLAIEKGLKDEKEVCEKAIFDFQKDHFLEWTKIFSENLSTYVDGNFYPEAGRFLNEFLKKEKS
jgi:TorA maturation chaperone TorD